MFKQVSICVVALCLSTVAYGQGEPEPVTTIQSYRVGDLASRSAFNLLTTGKTTSVEWGAEYPETLNALAELKVTVESLCSHKPASIRIYSPSLTLIVRHTEEGHEEIRQLLKILREADPVDLRLDFRALYSSADTNIQAEGNESEQKRLEAFIQQKRFTKGETEELIQLLPRGRELRHTLELSNGRRVSWADRGRPCTTMGSVDRVRSVAHIRIDFISDDPRDTIPFGSETLTLANGESALFNHDCDGGTVVWLVTASFDTDDQKKGIPK